MATPKKASGASVVKLDAEGVPIIPKAEPPQLQVPRYASPDLTGIPLTPAPADAVAAKILATETYGLTPVPVDEDTEPATEAPEDTPAGGVRPEFVDDMYSWVHQMAVSANPDLAAVQALAAIVVSVDRAIEVLAVVAQQQQWVTDTVQGMHQQFAGAMGGGGPMGMLKMMGAMLKGGGPNGG